MFQLCFIMSSILAGLCIWGIIQFATIHDEYMLGVMSALGTIFMMGTLVSACATCTQMKIIRDLR